MRERFIVRVTENGQSYTMTFKRLVDAEAFWFARANEGLEAELETVVDKR